MDVWFRLGVFRPGLSERLFNFGCSDMIVSFLHAGRGLLGDENGAEQRFVPRVLVDHVPTLVFRDVSHLGLSAARIDTRSA